MNKRHFKHSYVLCVSALLVVGGFGLWRQMPGRKELLNEQLTDALGRNDIGRALALVNVDANPNTRSTDSPPPLGERLLHLLVPPHGSAYKSSTAFMTACGLNAYGRDDSPRYRMETLRLVQAMLVRGADVNARDGAGGSALLAAAAVGRPDVARLLLEHGADVNVKDRREWTPLMAAAGSYPSAEETVRILLEHGANVNAWAPETGTPLVIAMGSQQDTGAARLLLEHGASVNIKTVYGLTPLMAARTPDAVRLLIRHGVDVNEQDDRGETALQACVRKMVDKRFGLAEKAVLLEIARLLLAHGANPNAADKKGTTPIGIAQKAGRGDLTALLQRGGAPP